MKEIVDDQTHDSLKQTYVQIELALDVVATEQVYTAHPRWDSFENTRHDPYLDTLEQEQTIQQNDTCDILDTVSRSSFNKDTVVTVNDLKCGYNFDLAHQQSLNVGEPIFIVSQHQPSAPQQYKSVGAQVLLATKTDISETSVGAQVPNATEKFAPQHEKQAHWVEKYWVERAGNKYWYFRYRWMSGRKSNRVYLGSVQSRRVQEKVEQVRDCIAEGKSPCEIKEFLITSNGR